MANGPKQKFFGNLNLDGIKKAVVEIPSKVDEYKGQKQLKVTASQWDDDGISLEIWTQETGSIKLGNLRVSSFGNEKAAAPTAASEADEDLPF